jgi:hypothetical protein
MAAAAAILPLCAAAVAMKTPAVTAIAGAQTTIDNQLNASTAMAMEMTTTMTMERQRRRRKRDGSTSEAAASLAAEDAA